MKRTSIIILKKLQNLLKRYYVAIRIKCDIPKKQKIIQLLFQSQFREGVAKVIKTESENSLILKGFYKLYMYNMYP